MTKETILVTGGAGFIGSNVNKLLQNSGYETVIIDNLSQGDRRAVIKGTFIEGDIGDPTLLQQIFEQFPIAAVMHFAAFINVADSVTDPIKYYENNVVNSLKLIESMQQHSIHDLVYSSSAAVYGEPLEKKIKETHACNPINPYGETKWMFEKILRDFDKAYGLRSCALRYFNAAGGDPEGEIKNYQKKDLNLIPIVLRSLIKGVEVTIFGNDYSTPDGTCIRDYIHVYDLGQAHLLAMEQLLKGKASSYYNLGNGKGFSVKEVIQATEKVTGKKVKFVEKMRRPGDPPILIADPQKAEKELGWKQKYSDLETMIEDAWKAMLQ